MADLAWRKYMKHQMVTRDKRSDDKIEEKINNQNLRKSYYILYILVALIVVIFGILSYFVFNESVYDILKDTVGNLVGVLAAFLIFDIINDRLSKDSYSQEMTKNILQALMAKPEILDSFTQEQKNLFIVSTVKSSVSDDDCVEMISNQCLSYFNQSNYERIRLSYDYKFEVYKKLPSSYDWLKKSDDYYCIQEILGYRVRYKAKSAKRIKDNKAYVGFLFNNKNLDSAFREMSTDLNFNSCIFRENLDINAEDIEYLHNLSSDELRNVFFETFKFDFQVNQYKGELKEVQINSIGILARFEVQCSGEEDENNIRIIFHMPKKYGSILQASIVDPTKAPKITVSYSYEEFNVDMYPYLSKGIESSYEVAHEQKNGIYDISLNTEWIYPISGIVFTIEKKN